MPVSLDNPYNPNPISKILVSFSLGFAVFYKVNTYFEWGIVLLISFLFSLLNLNFSKSIERSLKKHIIFWGSFFDT